jgi:hypothetical protein
VRVSSTSKSRPFARSGSEMLLECGSESDMVMVRGTDQQEGLSTVASCLRLLYRAYVIPTPETNSIEWTLNGDGLIVTAKGIWMSRREHV